MKVTLARKIGALLLLGAAGGFVGLVTFYLFLLETRADGAFINVAGRQRVLSEQLGQFARAVAQGQEASREPLKKALETFELSLRALRQGGDVMGSHLPPPSRAPREEAAEVERLWNGLKTPLALIAAKPAADPAVARNYAEVERRIRPLTEASDRLVAAYEARGQAIRRRTLYTLAAVAVLDLALLLVGLTVTRRYIVRPVELIQEAARRVQAGDFTHRVPAVTRDELRALAETMNDVSASMGRLFGERDEALRALLESERRYRLLFERNLAGVFRATPDGRIREGNGALARIFGYDSAEEVMAHHALELYFDDADGGTLTSRLRAERNLTDLEVRGRRRDGSTVWLLANVSLVEGAGDAPELVEGIVIDINRRKAAEETVRSLLRISEKLNSTLDLDTLMDDLVIEAIQLVGAESGCSGLRTPEGMACRKYFHRSSAVSLDRCWPPGRGLPGWLIENRIPYIANDASTDAQVDPDLCRRFNVRSAISVPILDTLGEVIGFFEIHNKTADSGFTPEDREKLAGVAQAVSIAIQNALTYRKTLRADEALRESEQRYRELVENANDVIYTRDLAGNFTSFNRAAERVTGYAREEALKKNIAEILAPEYPKLPPQLTERKAADGGPATYELEIVRKDGRRVTLEVSTRLIYEDGVPVGVQGIARDVTERKRAENSLRQLSGRLLRLQDEERRRIARELHDSTAQSLAALAVNLSRVNEAAAQIDRAAGKALSESIDLTEQSLREIRTLSYLLHPPLLDELGLTSALKWYADGFAERSGVQVDLDVAPTLGRLHQDLETTLFRIVQECLTNIHRHSGSPRASIRIVPNSTEVLLEVRDEGRGIPRESLDTSRAASAGLGVGIAGMRERVSQLGGRLEIVSGGPGTTVTAVLPLARSES